jgi:GAF domain-containing protein
VRVSDRAAAGSSRSGFTAPSGSDAVQRLARVTGELGSASTLAAIVDAAVEHAAEAIHAAVTTLMVREGDMLRLIGGHGLRPGVQHRFQRFPVAAPGNPASVAVREARPIVLADPAAVEEQFPDMQGEMPAGRSLVCLPLGTGSPVGVVGLTFDGGWVPGPRELDLLVTFAEACGQAIRRVRAASEAAERADQLAFLADASAELGSSLDYRSTLANVARLVVPGLADWCAVDVLDGDKLSTLAVAHADPAKVEWAWELQRRYPADPDAPTGAPHVARTGVSELHPRITDEMLVAGARDAEHLRISRELELHTAMIVPLTARNRPLGAITLIRAETPRPYGPADLLVAEDLGRRAGTAIDNAHLYSQTRDAALELQRAVLPGRLGEIAGWQVAAHYEPGGAAEVGGDFYDAVRLPSGALALFIGDVMGHGVPAAAAMAQLRASVRAFAAIDPAPETVLARLEQLVERLPIEQLVSMVYAVADPGAGRLEIVNAGHYPPLLVRADGTTRFCYATRRRLLGTDPDDCTATVLPFASGDTVLLFTDGLIERRGEHIDTGLDRLLTAAGALRSTELAAGLADLVAQVRGDVGDDLTALAVRADPALSSEDEPPADVRQ